MGRLALIAGSSLRGETLPDGEWEVLQRHGEAVAYVLPHRIDHVANLRALQAAGCDRVLALSSVGGLRAELSPGTLVCPDDFIAIGNEPLTALEGADAHTAPGFDQAFRGELVGALADAGIEFVDGGIYWQSPGPRLESRAEVRVIAPHAEVVGMTVASECVVAGELGLRYAALCVVDNLAHGIGDRELSLAEIERNRAANRDELEAVIAAILPRLAG
jgi:5'-methylthioadenosine phosphorylase